MDDYKDVIAEAIKDAIDDVVSIVMVDVAISAVRKLNPFKKKQQDENIEQ